MHLEAAEIWNGNENIFSDSDFLPSYMTDRPEPNENNPAIAENSSTINENESANTNENRSTINKQATTIVSVTPEKAVSEIVSPEEVRQFPKAGPRQNNKKKKGQKEETNGNPNGYSNKRGSGTRKRRSQKEKNII